MNRFKFRNVRDGMIDDHAALTIEGGTMRLLACIIVAIVAVGTSLVPAESLRASNEDGERMVCKYQLQTGTRFKTKICKTAAEWEAMAEAHREGLRDSANRPQIQLCDPRNGCN